MGADRIIRCEEWGAKAGAHPAQPAGRPDRIIFHHTAGHHVEIDGEYGDSTSEAIRYAQDIQHYHMGSNGWSDSGHNFLVTRGGHILEGRHGTVDAISRGRMIVSAHCPGQNDQPGIEHEHLGEKEMTDKQRSSSLWLHVWIMRKCGIRPTEIYGHRHFYNTSCPAELDGEIMRMRLACAHQLTADPYRHVDGEMWRWFLWKDRGALPAEREQARVHSRVPARWWPRYQLHRRSM